MRGRRGVFSREAGRRKAGYVIATPGAPGFDDMGTFVESPLANFIRLTTGAHLVLEVKGRTDDEAKAKRAALDEWIVAVHTCGGFGAWKSAVSFSTDDISTRIAAAIC